MSIYNDQRHLNKASPKKRAKIKLQLKNSIGIVLYKLHCLYFYMLFKEELKMNQIIKMLSMCWGFTVASQVAGTCMEDNALNTLSPHFMQISLEVKDSLSDGITCQEAMKSHIVLYNGDYTDKTNMTRTVRVLFVNVLDHETEAVHSHEHFSVMFWPEGGELKSFIWKDAELHQALGAKAQAPDAIVAELGKRQFTIGQEPQQSFFVNFFREEPSHKVEAGDSILKALRVEFSNTFKNPQDLDFVAKEDFKTRSLKVQRGESLPTLDEDQTKHLESLADLSLELLMKLNEIGALDLMNADKAQINSARAQYLSGTHKILKKEDLKAHCTLK